MAQREKVTATTKDASRQKLVRRAMESAMEYNLYLNRQRQRVYMDLQTDTPNYPVGLGRQNKTLTETNNIGRFPVAVMPCQYQDWYVEYTPEELQFLPVDTVLKGPIMRIDQLPPVLTTPDVSDFESDSESRCSSSDSCSDCSCCADDANTNSANNHNNNDSISNGKKSHGDNGNGGINHRPDDTNHKH